jgi:Holliday junction resolvasome RuvABC endonuclease subunit
MTLVIGIDPGVRSGYCIRINEKVEKFGTILFEKVKAQGILRIAKDLCKIGEPAYMAIELQYLDEGKKKNVQSLIKLVKIRTHWEDFAEALGFKLIEVYPSQWINSVLGSRMVRKEIQEMSILRASLEIGVSKSSMSPDSASAINISLYSATLIGMEERSDRYKNAKKTLQLPKDVQG